MSTFGLRRNDKRRGSAPIASATPEQLQSFASKLKAPQDDSASSSSRKGLSSSPDLSSSTAAAFATDDDLEYAKSITHRKASVTSPLQFRTTNTLHLNSTINEQATGLKLLVYCSEKDLSNAKKSIDQDSVACEVIYTHKLDEALKNFFHDPNTRIFICWDNLPTIDAVSVLQTISEGVSFSRADVIVVLVPPKANATIDYDRRDELVSLGAMDVIQYPFHPTLLMRRVERSINYFHATEPKFSMTEEEETSEIDGEILKLKSALKQKDSVVDDLRHKVKLLCFRIVLLDKERKLKEDKKNFLSQQLEEKEQELELLRKAQEVGTESDVETMKRKIEQAFETPVQGLIRSLEQLSTGSYNQGELQNILLSAIKSIGSSDLYAPQFQKLLSDSSLDSMTRSWIRQEFQQDSDATSPKSGGLEADQIGSPLGGITEEDESAQVDETTRNGENPTDVQVNNDGAEQGDSQNTGSVTNEPPKDTSETASASVSNGTVPAASASENSPQKTNTKETVTPLESRSSSKSLLGKPTELHVSVTPQVLPFATPGKFDQNLRRTDCDVLSLDENGLVDLIVEIFKELNLIDKYSIDIPTLRNLAFAVRDNYHENPYHNFQHAVDVLHSCFLMLTCTHITEYLTHIDVLALSFAAICHDLDHPGVNNAFLVNCQASVAMTYNDQSVLENHHCFKAFSILKQANNNIAQSLSASEFKEFRKIVVNAILNTDMARHFELLAKFTTHVQTKPFTRDSMDDRMLLLSMALHTADLGNVMRPPHVSRNWSERVMAEFLLQGDVEKVVGIPVSPYMDRNDTDPAKMTLNFLDFIAVPLVESVRMLLPDFQTAYENTRSNRALWADIHKQTTPTLPVTFPVLDSMLIGVYGSEHWNQTILGSRNQEKEPNGELLPTQSGSVPSPSSSSQRKTSAGIINGANASTSRQAGISWVPKLLLKPFMRSRTTTENGDGEPSTEDSSAPSSPKSGSSRSTRGKGKTKNSASESESTGQ